MDKYIGVKIVNAEPAYRTTLLEGGESKIIVSAELPTSNGGAETQLGYKVVYEDGYVSWCPKDTFEKANRKTDGLTFGLAVEALKKGFKVCRKGWNGKGMWLTLVPVGSYFMTESWAMAIQGINRLPWIGMKTADNSFVPWLASQTDVLAEDWMIVD